MIKNFLLSVLCISMVGCYRNKQIAQSKIDGVRKCVDGVCFEIPEGYIVKSIRSDEGSDISIQAPGEEKEIINIRTFTGVDLHIGFNLVLETPKSLTYVSTSRNGGMVKKTWLKFNKNNLNAFRVQYGPIAEQFEQRNDAIAKSVNVSDVEK